MLKILRHEFSSKSFFQPFLVFYKQFPEQQKLTQKHSVCQTCFNSQLFLSSYSKCVNILSPTPVLDVCHWFSVKSCQETVIEQEVETVKGKQFIENESKYHHKVLEDSNVYSSTVYKSEHNFIERYRLSDEEFEDLISTKDWKTKSPYHVAKDFVSFGVYSASKLKLTMDDELFNELTWAFVDKCASFTDDQLIDCLIAIQIWPQSDHVKTVNFLQIWKTLDSVCFERYMDWTVDKILFMMDLWYQLKLLRLSNFVFKGLNKISRKCSDLTRAQMIQIMFYMSCVRKLHPSISMREYEYYLQKYITHLTIEEIGIFALAFFKTKTSILNDKLLMYTMQRVAEEIHTIDEVTLTAIAKAVRFSHKPNMALTANDLVLKLAEQRMDSLKLVSCIHIAHISTKVQFFNEKVITKLAERFCANPTEVRLKEMERVALLLSLFNYIPPTTPEILDIMIQQLDLPQHVKAGEEHPIILVSLVYFLTLLRTFPEKFIKHMLSEESLKKNYDNKYMIAVQVLQIDYNRVLEGPQGSEHLLLPSMREYLARRNSIFTPDQQRGKLNNFDQMMMDVMNLTKEVLGGDEYSMVTYTLPHFPRADILFRLDSEGRPVPISEEFRSRRLFEDVVRPEGDGWRCVVVGSRNMYMHNVPRLVGEHSAKLRQLKLLGYTPIVIPTHYWNAEKNKADYLKLKYFSTPR